MSKPYSQSKALWAITRASFKAIFNHPTAIVFSLLFPIIFIMIFGAFSNRSNISVRVAFDSSSDTTNQLYSIINNVKGITVLKRNPEQQLEALKRGAITAIIRIQKNNDTAITSPYLLQLKTSEAVNPQNIQVLITLLNAVIKSVNDRVYPHTPTFAVIREEVEKIPGRQFRQIDFILPGQLGFSILFSTLFGIAFTFFNLREQLVLKRFFASPVSRVNILLGIGTSRLFFQLLNVIILVVIGHFFLHFTLQHGWFTLLEILVMTVIMLFLLMGVGLIFSSIAKSDTSIPLLINLFGFPQILLAGTFFPIDVFPKWLQQLCYILPMTHFNNAIRSISFEGNHLTDCWKEIAVLGIWIVVVYFLVSRLIRWEK
jgi:ABC-2 type transport system permease protein